MREEEIKLIALACALLCALAFVAACGPRGRHAAAKRRGHRRTHAATVRQAADEPAAGHGRAARDPPGRDDYDLSGFGGGAAWGDLAYGTVSITSNGYMQMGEAEGGAEYVPQDMPDPANPNAVLAPYWTDLNLADGGDIHIALADDGANYTFFVIQWEDAPIWGSCATACENRTFQIWLSTQYFADTYNGGLSYITFEYPGAMGPGAGNDDGDTDEGDGLNVGAEDINGDTGADLGIDVEPDHLTPCLYPPFDPCGGYYVDIGPSTAGGTKTITYDVKGKSPGRHKIIANMTSDVSVGTAKDVVKLTVTP